MELLGKWSCRWREPHTPASHATLFAPSPPPQVCHTYDHLTNARLLTQYGYVASPDEAPLPTPAVISWASLLSACESVRDACNGGAGGYPITWPVAGGWSENCLLYTSPSPRDS